MEIQSKRHSAKVYLTTALVIVVFGLIGSLIFMPFIDRQHKTNNPFLFLLSSFCYTFIIYHIYRVRKNSPAVIINRQGISITGQCYQWEQTTRIQLTGKHPYPYIFSTMAEGMSFDFRNGQTVTLFDDMYQNTWQLKLFIQQVIIEKGEYRGSSCTPATKAEINNELFTDFAGLQLASMQGFTVWLMVFLSGYVFFNRDKEVVLLTFLSLHILLVAAAVNCNLCYFQVSKRFIVIRIHNLPNPIHIIHLDDILEVKFEAGPKGLRSLQVITKDFKNRLYNAGTLSNRKWLFLKEELESYQIHVEDTFNTSPPAEEKSENDTASHYN